MASQESKTTKVLISVVSGMILAGLLYTIRQWVFPFFRFLGSAFTEIWSWIMSNHSLPGWLLIFLLICGISVIFRIIAFIFPKHPSEPHWSEFTEFEFMGVLWRWRFSGHELFNLRSFCSKSACKLQTYDRIGRYLGAGRDTTLYKCDRCGHTQEIDGNKEEVESRVLREIDRLMNNGGWREYICPTTKSK